MKHKIAAAILILLGAAFLWQAFGQTDCWKACKAKYDECMKQSGGDDWYKMHCDLVYADCKKGCK